MSSSVVARLEQLLQRHQVAFEVLRHAPVYTSQQAAAVRGTPLGSGAKALILRGDETFAMFVLPADRRLASRVVRRWQRWRKLRFASREEVWQMTGLQPGAIPPFGQLFGLTTFCDYRMAENETINFNAGDHSVSISMRYEDYVKVESPLIGTVAE